MKVRPPSGCVHGLAWAIVPALVLWAVVFAIGLLFP